MAQLGELVERAPQTSLGRPMTGAQLVAEGRRAVVRALRRRLAELETTGFEQLCAALLEKMGMRDVRVAKRSKEGPLYLARQRRGVSDLRVAVKLVRGAREIARQDVQELRKDLAHYSAQMGLVLAAGEAGREARSEASAAGQAPVALYAGDALPEEMIDLHVGVTVQLVEIPDVDEAFFASAAKAQPGQVREEKFSRERERDRDDRPRDRPRERPAEGESDRAPEAAAAEAAPSPAEPAAVQAAPESPAEPVPAPAAAEGPGPVEDAQKEGRRPRRGREDRPRAMTPAEQAWGQPAGTLRTGNAPMPSAEGPAAEPGPSAEGPGPVDAAASTNGADAAGEPAGDAREGSPHAASVPGAVEAGLAPAQPAADPADPETHSPPGGE